MFGRSALFKDVQCPYYETGLCERPYCLFKHATRSTNETSSGSGAASNASSSVSSGDAEIVGSMPFIGYMGYVGSPRTRGRQRPGDLPASAPPPRPNVEPPPPPRPKPAAPPPPPLTVADFLPLPQSVEPKAKAKPPKLRPAASTATKAADSAADLNTYAKQLVDIDRQIADLQRKMKDGKPTAPPSTSAYTPTPIAKLQSQKHGKPRPAPATVAVSADPPAYEPEMPEPSMLSPRADVEAPPPTASQKLKAERRRVGSQPVGGGEDAASRQAADAAKRRKRKQSNSQPVEPAAVDAATRLEAAVPAKLNVAAVVRGSRTAHDASHDPNALRQRVGTAKGHIATPRQQLQMRFASLQKSKEQILLNAAKQRHGAETKPEDTDDAPPPPKAVCLPAPSTNTAVDHRLGAAAATQPKGERRIAHTPNAAAAVMAKVERPRIVVENGARFPGNVRQRYLDVFFDECAKFCQSVDEASAMALDEEKAICSRATTKGGYLSAAVNTVKRLREHALRTKAPVAADDDAPPPPQKRASVAAALQRSFQSKELDERFFVDRLGEFELTVEQLAENGFPLSGDTPRSAVICGDGAKRYVDDSELGRVCSRCGKQYRLTADGDYVLDEECIYHWGKAWKRRAQGAVETRYTCCQGDLTSSGCATAARHVTESVRRSELDDFVRTAAAADGASGGAVYALDCEMVYTAWGPALARLTVVDAALASRLDLLVRPSAPLVDSNVRFSGLTTERVLGAPLDFDQARDQFVQLISADTLLIGHSLESDLRALRVIHERVVDTSVVFPHRLGRPYKRALKTLAAEFLRKIIQDDVGGHDSLEDASSCMQLMRWKVTQNSKSPT